MLNFKTIPASVFLFLILLISLPALAKLPSVEERLDAGGIVKDIAMPTDGNMAHVNVQAIVETPPKAVWDALKDIENWPRWLPMSKTARFLSIEAESKITQDIAKSKEDVVKIDAQYPNTDHKNDRKGSWQRLVYEEYDLPWPIKNEWVVRRYTYDDGDEKSRASWRKIDGSSADDDGYWEVSKWKNGKTHLRYYYRIKVKHGAPKVLFKGAVSLTVNSMIKALRKEAKRRI
jgi:ribosome-associated toxin RatA of RatAB toxin-antitoxin module